MFFPFFRKIFHFPRRICWSCSMFGILKNLEENLGLTLRHKRKTGRDKNLTCMCILLLCLTYATKSYCTSSSLQWTTLEGATPNNEEQNRGKVLLAFIEDGDRRQAYPSCFEWIVNVRGEYMKIWVISTGLLASLWIFTETRSCILWTEMLTLHQE